MTKYFVRIDGEQKGPFTLEELPGAGVTPDTYVWCKGMADWELASKDAEICRYYRQRLAGTLPQKEENAEEPAPKVIDLTRIGDGESLKMRDVIREINRVYEEQLEAEGREPYSDPPRIPYALAILATLFCFPPTGILAIYYCMKAKKMWSSATPSPEDRDKRREAYDLARRATMITGITLFLGLILWAAIVNFW